MDSRIDNMKDIRNMVSDAGGVKGTSLADVKGQEILGIGLPPVRKELDRSPLEAAKDEYNPLETSDFSQTVQKDANVHAIKLTNLDGFPE
ncbi:MAG: hypothetical protein LBF34_01375 [Puniceicoccales bacterium]|jgi:hypothetical protein|nr:hypothetical protein [Puniceicoccales bacterium]